MIFIEMLMMRMFARSARVCDNLKPESLVFSVGRAGRASAGGGDDNDDESNH